jgi:hypothetical protein
MSDTFVDLACAKEFEALVRQYQSSADILIKLGEMLEHEGQRLLYNAGNPGHERVIAFSNANKSHDHGDQQ